MRTRSKARLHRGRQAAEEPPRQSRVVDQDNPPSFGNHVGYIANHPAADNEWRAKKKGRHSGPFTPNSRILLACRSLGAFRSAGTLGLGDARLLAAESAQIVKLGAADFAAEDQLD